MNPLKAPGREAAAVQDKPETLEQCHAAIEQMGQELAQLREQVSTLLDKKLNSLSSVGAESSDNRVQRRASGRARGTPPGHNGAYRTLLEESEVDSSPRLPAAGGVRVRWSGGGGPTDAVPALRQSAEVAKGLPCMILPTDLREDE